MPVVHRWELIYPLYIVLFYLLRGYTELFAEYPPLKHLAYAGLLVSGLALCWIILFREWWSNRSAERHHM